MVLRVPILGCSFAGVVAASCITGPPSDRASPTAALDGRRYQQPPSRVLMFPLAARASIPTRVAGVVLEDLGLSVRQLPDIDVVLIRNGEILFRTKSNHDGSFAFSGSIPDGDYRLRASTPERQEAEMSLRVDRDVIEGLRLFMRKPEQLAVDAGVSDGG